MKREILYRGRKLYDGSREYGFLSWADTPRGRSYFVNNQIVDPETVGQFTGVPDVNGKNIFEGDHDKDGNCVVFCERCNGWQFAQIDIPTKDICIPCHCCDGNFMFNDIINQFEITGNIHDNKELLK